MRRLLVIAALSFGQAAVLPQQQSALTSVQPGLPVGVWEVPQPNGSVIGIDLAAVPASAPDAPEAGTPKQRSSRLQVGIFQRNHEGIACGEENFFVMGSTDPASSNTLMTYANGKLRIDYRDRADGSEIHVELTYDPVKDVWTGHFQRKTFDGQVTLHRTSDRPDPAEGGCVIAA